MTTQREMNTGTARNREVILMGERDDGKYQYISLADGGELKNSYRSNGAVYVDTVNGSAGTDAPLGLSPENPVNSIDDAITIASANSLNNIYVIQGMVTPTVSIDNYEISAYSNAGFAAAIDLNGQSCDNTKVNNMIVYGSGDGSGTLVPYRCMLGYNNNDLDSVDIVYGRDCVIGGGDVVANNQIEMFGFCNFDATAGGVVNQGVVKAGDHIHLYGIVGEAIIGGLDGTGSKASQLHFLAGKLKIDASATGGTIDLFAECESITDNAGGAVTVNNYTPYGRTKGLDNIYDRQTDGTTKNVQINRDLPWLTEFFETESLDANTWDETLDGAGTGAFATGAGYMYYDIDTEAVADSDAFLNSAYRFQSRPATFGDSNTLLNKLILEFEMRTTGTIANTDNTHFLMGLCSAKSNDITTNDLAGFILDTDTLTARTDDGGTDEDTDVSSGITVTNWNKYKIIVEGDTYKFYINGTLVATHTTQVPDVAMYIVFGTRAEGANIVGFDVTNIRCYYEEVA